MPSSSLSSHPMSSRLGKNVISIASGKGGVGKTWLAVTLAHAISRRNRRVLLFDGDLGMANVDIQLGLTVTYDLVQVMSGKVDLSNAITRYNGGNFDIIAGRPGSGNLASLDRKRLLGLRKKVLTLAGRYDTALLDLGAGIEQSVRLLTVGTGCCLVVTNHEPTALTDAYAFIKVTQHRSPGTNIRIVVNSASSFEEGQRTYETVRKACENFLKISPPLAGIVRRDSKVAESIRNQTSILTRFPNSEAAADVEKLAGSLIEGQ